MSKTKGYDEKEALTSSNVQVGPEGDFCAACGTFLRLDRLMLILRSGRVRCARPCPDISHAMGIA